MQQNQSLNDTAKRLLNTLALGKLQSHANMQVFPLFHPKPAETRYITLTEALDAGTLTVTEITEGGSVPELAVINTGDMPVLLLDGEELVGAKQNRVLNSTILIKKQSKAIIPVSCTEQGRWSYDSPVFKASEVIMHRSARARKSRSVSSCLSHRGAFASNQGAVWESIEELQQAADASSPTGAMRDVFSQREGALRSYLEAFPAREDQLGILVLVNSAPIGFDYVSAPGAYTHLHAKLLRSYAMDAMVVKQAGAEGAGAAPAPEAATQAARAMLHKASTVSEHRHKSVGHGWDHRFTGDHLVGSSLQYHNEVIHAAFFVDEGEARGAYSRMAGANRRRYYRR